MPAEILEFETRVLGSEERIDKLVTWSLDGSPGDKGIKEFPFGLRLGFVKNGACPKIYIHWNQSKFNKFMESFGEVDCFSITAYGIEIVRNFEHTSVTLIGAADSSQVLWDTETIEFSRQQENEDVNWVVGMIILSEDGPMFYTTPETHSQLEESAAVAVIDTAPKAETLSRVLPKQRVPLSPKVLEYLAQTITGTELPTP